MDNLKFTDIKVRTVNVPLKKPIIAHIGTFEYWPYICLDLYTNSKIVGKSYIGPYLVDQLPSIVNCINSLAKIYLGRNIRPFNFYRFITSATVETVATLSSKLSSCPLFFLQEKCSRAISFCTFWIL